jgi:hypothetical protein
MPKPMLQTGAGVAYFFKQHRGARVASTTLMAPMSREFVKKIHTFANDNQIKMVRFEKGQRKDDITRQRLQRFEPKEGVVHIGVAQEKFSTFRVEKKRNATGEAFTWLSRSKVMCNQYYFYLLDRGFGYEALDNGLLSCEAPNKPSTCSISWMRRRFKRWCANGLPGCRIHFLPGIGVPATGMSCQG